MINNPISITAISSISSLGISSEEIWKNYKSNQHFITSKNIGDQVVFVSEISIELQKEIEKIKHSESNYKNLDATVLYAIFVARKAIKKANWNANNNFGINIGSSRGATQLFEKYHQEFLKNKLSDTLSSPTTTLGNISSWVSHDLQTKGPEISHSITCSTGLHALLNGLAWINAGMSNTFLVGASEAPLTSFTIAQMQALKIYAKQNSPNLSPQGRSLSGVEVSRRDNYPCQALNLNKTQNTMVLGEGAAVACLEKGIQNNALAIISGVGYATEPLNHNVSLTTNAICFQKSMQMALKNISPKEIDVIITHTPGTIKGDLAEVKAIQEVFGSELPALTTNKWKLGHTFATSGMLSLEMAILMLQHQEFIAVPYLKGGKQPKKTQNILINAVGFGGNAVSILLSKV